jgi:hypothetical protein
MASSSRSSNRSGSARDDDGTLGSVFLVSGDGHLLSLPIPSNSPNDPLSWSLLKRCCIIFIITAFGTVGIAVQQFPPLITVALAKEMRKTVGDRP